MKRIRFLLVSLLVLVISTGVPLLIEWWTTPGPVERHIHIEAFRYGTSPSIIRVNRGDRLFFTFSTLDTGHSFFLQDYRVDAKIPPSSDAIYVYDPFHPEAPSTTQKVLSLKAGLNGFPGSLASVSRFRCHVYCGLMHGFEQGDLIIRPNWLLALSLGLLLALPLIGYIRVRWYPKPWAIRQRPAVDLNRRFPFLRRLLKSRVFPFALVLPVLTLFLVVIMAGFLGTKVGGRNLATMLVWATWMFLITVVFVPLGGRIWCLACPLPFPGETFQRGGSVQVQCRRDDPKKNRYFGFGWRWPGFLRGPWIRLFFFLSIGSLSASLAGKPLWTAILLSVIFGLALLISVFFERRAFCVYVCPVTAFISLYSPMGRLMVRPRDLETCRQCREKFCLTGNEKGWGCPYGLLVPALNRNMDCGVCGECFKSCSYENVSLAWRRGPWQDRFRNSGEALLAVVMFTLAIVYSLTIHSPWYQVRNAVNVVDKATWPQFGAYVAGLWVLSLLIMPGIFWLLTRLGLRSAGLEAPAGEAFRKSVLVLIPIGLFFWASFFVANFMSNFTFIRATLSDPFNWGWDVFGTARLPWIQIWPAAVPWIQSALILSGLMVGLRRGFLLWYQELNDIRRALRVFQPTALFCIALSAMMIVYITNF